MKSLVHIMKHMIVQGGAELTDTLQNTVLLYIGVQGGQSLRTKNETMLRHFKTCSVTVDHCSTWHVNE
jgi:hypothetical protein